MAGSFPNVVSVSYLSVTSGGNGTINYPSNMTVGDVCVCVIASDGDNVITWPSTGNDVWNKIKEFSNGIDVTISVAWHRNNGLETGDFDVTSSANEVLAACVYNIEDAYDPATYPPEVSSGATGDSTDPDPDSHTTTYGTADTMFIGLCAVDRRNIVSYPTNCPDDNIEDGGGGSQDASCGMANDGIDNSTFNPDNFGCGTADEWCACTVSLYRDGSLPETVFPAAITLTISVPTPTIARTEYPSATTLSISVPTPTINRTEYPSALTLTISVPTPTVTFGALTVFPPAVTLTISVPTPVIARREYPTATTLPITALDASANYVVAPDAIALPISVPTPTINRTERPDAIALTISVPTPVINRTEYPGAITLTISVPTPVVAGIVRPDAVTLTISVPTPVIARTEYPAALTLTISVPTPTIDLGAENVLPPAVTLTISVPTPVIARTEYPTATTLPITALAGVPRPLVAPDAITLTISVPTPTIARTERPTATTLTISVPTPDINRTEAQAALTLPISVPTPDIVGVVAPDAIALTISVPTPVIARTEKPDALALTISVPTPTVDLGAGAVTIYPEVLALAISVPTPYIFGGVTPSVTPTTPVDRSDFLYSGEPLPIPPPDTPEVEAFTRKLLDYLRRLSAKLSSTIYSISNIGTIDSFAAGLAADQDIPTTNWTGIDWDDPLRADSAFTHSATTNPDEITLAQEGFYALFLNLQLVVPPSDVELRLVNQDAQVLDYSIFTQATDTINAAGVAYMCPFFAAAGGKIEVQIKVATGGDDIESEQTRLLIMRLGGLEGSGGVPGVNPGDDPWWKYT